jgi:hypothetical protein
MIRGPYNVKLLLSPRYKVDAFRIQDSRKDLKFRVTGEVPKNM